MTVSGDQLTVLILSYFWPFLRIGAMLIAAPIFGNRNMVFSIHRLGLAVFLTLVVHSQIPAIPPVDPVSASGMLLIARELMIGFAMGFMLQYVFGSLVIAGHSVALTMGLGFASFVDPSSGQSVPVVGMFYLVMGILIFFGLNGHLVALQVLAESFTTLPVGGKGISQAGIWSVVIWGAKMYAGALLIALPCMITITLINIAFGVMTRAAPQMNIFAVGFPTTLMAGVIVIMLTLPNLLPRFSSLVMDAFKLIQTVLVR